MNDGRNNDTPGSQPRKAGQLAAARGRAEEHGRLGHPGGLRSSPGAPERTDAEIIALSVHDPGPFSVLFKRHADEILRYAHARLGPDLAEDVLADTFLAAFQRREHYDPSYANAGPWLYGIAIREIGRHRRAEQRSRRALSRVPADLVIADFGDRSDERVSAQQLRPLLVSVLAGLSHQDREVLLLIAWAGLSYEETAQALGMTVATVRSRLHRIRARTRKALGGIQLHGRHRPARCASADVSLHPSSS